MSTPNEFGDYSAFVKLTESVVFAPANQSILDSIYLRPRFRIRCLTQIFSQNSPTLKSRSIEVSLESSGCGQTPSSGISSGVEPFATNGDLRFVPPLVFDRRPFSASADYVSADFITSNPNVDVQYLNLIRLSVEVAYVEGSVPLVSTLPLHNYRQLLTDPSYARTHPCSNLAESTFVKRGFLPGNFRPNSSRNNHSLDFYSHLNRASCKWLFVAFYDMSEFTSLCQAQIVSDAESSEPSFLTIKIPVHVAHVFAGSQASWSSVEYETVVEASVTYRTSQETEYSNGLLNHNQQLLSLLVDKITLNNEGRLQIEFTTIPSFRGFFTFLFLYFFVLLYKL